MELLIDVLLMFCRNSILIINNINMNSVSLDERNNIYIQNSQSLPSARTGATEYRKTGSQKQPTVITAPLNPLNIPEPNASQDYSIHERCQQAKIISCGLSCSVQHGTS